VLLAACLGISEWHKDTRQMMYEHELDGWYFITTALGEKLDEQDAYIERLEFILETITVPPAIDPDIFNSEID
jgi:hypothetical protein